MKFIGFILILISLSSFAKTIPRRNDDDLTQAQAILRRQQVKSVSYRLHFDLKKKTENYNAAALISLELFNTDEPLSLDFLDKKISSLKVNGELINKYPLRKGSFDIPAKYLKSATEIEVIYSGVFNKTSGGFIKSIDPEDGSEYLFTDFEPYYAHNLFPCFDQPDLKARFTVTVKAPSDWKVIQNEIVQSTKEDGTFTTTQFQMTPPISTYLFFLGAGPFVEWKDKAGDIPLFLYARKTLEKYVDHEAIFKTTKAGLKFYNDYFHYPYPFSKFGQLFIPEFAWGGMENPGAITLNERNIFRGPVSVSTYERRDNLILHEMAHMWFGDLVTMQWWNDLWLNESFATYLAGVAQDRALKAPGTWPSFFSTKTWGYWQDQLITTHPIETDVPDVRTARGNFDGITYAKGASALKQLHYFAGEDGFREGLRHYFKTFAFKNTQRKDFIGAIGTAAKIDLTDWTNKWLQTAGPNKVAVNFTCKDGEITSFDVKQTPSVSNTLSPHRTKFALYRANNSKLKELQVIDVLYTKELTPVKSVLGKDCPDFILPNFDDQDYAIYSLDEKSLEKSKYALTSLPDPLSRAMMWSILTQMVRDQRLKPIGFIEIALAALTIEENDLLLGNIIGRNSWLRDQYLLYLNTKERLSIAGEMETTIWKRVTEAKPGSSLQMIFFDFYVTIAQTPDSQKKLAEMLKSNTPPRGIILDQDRRWALVSTFAMNGLSDASKLIDAELKNDSTTQGKRMAYGARAGLPNLKSKKTYFESFFGKQKIPFSNFREAASRFNSPNQEKLIRHFAKDFFQKVMIVDWQLHDDDVELFFDDLFPTQLCTPEVLKLSQNSILKAKKLTGLARRSWLEAQDELDRCVKIRTPIDKT